MVTNVIITINNLINTSKEHFLCFIVFLTLSNLIDSNAYPEIENTKYQSF